MTTIAVDTFRFDFEPNWAAQKYDEWAHYAQLLAVRPLKAVDLVAVRLQQPPGVAWLIEAKDFRIITIPPEPSNLIGLAETVRAKVRDTLTGLSDAAIHAQETEWEHAIRTVASGRYRVVLHLEPYVGPKTKLFPRNFEAGVLQKLKQVVRDLDRNPLVLKISNTPRAGVPWSVR